MSGSKNDENSKVSVLDSKKDESLFPNAFLAKKKEEQRNKKSGVPGKRWGHCSVIHNNKLYLFGGICGNPKAANNLYALSCETLQWERITLHQDSRTNLESRDSQSLVKIGQTVYVFGGSNQDETYNDMFAFNLERNLWEEIQAKGELPESREGHSAVEFRDKGFIVYGGSQKSKLFNDIFFFDTSNSHWRRLRSLDPMPCARENFSLVNLNNELFLFGGQSLVKDSNREEFYDDLWKLIIEDKEGVMQCQWTLIHPNSTRNPSPRASHTANVYKEKYIIVVGGESYPPPGNDPPPEGDDGEENNPFFPLADIWVYDTILNVWTPIIPKNKLIFSPRSAHSASLFNDSLIIYGGLLENHEFSNELFELTFECSERLIYNIFHKKDLQLCSYCKTALLSEEMISDKDSEVSFFEGKNAFEEIEKSGVSIDFISSISSLISWPLAAFGLLIDSFIQNNADNIRISFKNVKASSPQGVENAYKRIEEVVIISEDGDTFTPTDFISLMAAFKWRDGVQVPKDFSDLNSVQSEVFEERNQKILREYGTMLKIASLRIGQSFIFISRKKSEVCMALVSSSKKHNPNPSQNYVFISSWDVESGKFLTPDGRYMKKIIMDSVLFLFSEEQIIPAHDGNILIIFDLKKLPTDNGEYLSEITGVKKDIQLRIPKLPGVERGTENLDLTQFIDFSLKNYLNFIFLNPIETKIFLNDEQVESGLYPRKLSSCSERGLISVLDFNLNEQDKLMFPQRSVYVNLNVYEQKLKLRQEVMDKIVKVMQRDELIEIEDEPNPEKVSNLPEDTLQGVLMYYQDRLVCRLQKRRFGNLFSHISKMTMKREILGNKFLFRENGILILPEILKPNPFSTDIVNDLYASIACKRVKNMISNCFRASIDAQESKKRRGIEKFILEEVAKKCVKKD